MSGSGSGAFPVGECKSCHQTTSEERLTAHPECQAQSGKKHLLCIDDAFPTVDGKSYTGCVNFFDTCPACIVEAGPPKAKPVLEAIQLMHDLERDQTAAANDRSIAPSVAKGTRSRPRGSDAEKKAGAENKRSGPRLPPERQDSHPPSPPDVAEEAGEALPKPPDPPPMPPDAPAAPPAPRPVEMQEAIDLGTHGAILRTIPKGSEQVWAAACRPACVAYAAAHRRDDINGKAEAIKQFHLLPGQCLTIPTLAEREAQGGFLRTVRRNIAARLEGEDRADAQLQEQDSRELDETKRRINRSKRMLKLINVGGANQNLKRNNGIADLRRPEKLAEYKALHPSRPANAPPIPRRPDAPPAIVGSEEIKKLIRRAPRGRAPGPSGMTAEHLKPLMKHDDIREGIALMLQDISNGSLPYASKMLLLHGKGLPIEKEKGGIRPIAMGEVLFKLAAVRLLLKNRKNILKALKPHQYGVAVSAGCEKACHRAQQLLENPYLMLSGLKLDLLNAFNTVDRAAFLTQLAAEPELNSMCRLVWWAYEEPTPVTVYDAKGEPVATIMSEQGAKQGDPLGPFLCGLGMKLPLQQIEKKVPGVRLITVVDDMLLILPQYDLRTGAAEAEKALKKANLQINWPKGAVLHFHDTQLDRAIIDWAQAKQVRIDLKMSEYLGAPIGVDEAAMSEYCMKVARKHDAYFERLKHPLFTDQEAHIMITQAGKMHMDYLCRVARPAVTEKGATHYQNQVLSVMTSRCRTGHLDADQERQAKLPTRRSGLGLGCAADTRHMAFLGAVHQTATEVNADLVGAVAADGKDAKDARPEAKAFNQAIADAVKVVKQQLGARGDVLLPKSADLAGFASHELQDEEKSLQRVLFRRFHERVFDSLIQQALERKDYATAARIRACGAPKASTVFVTLPTAPNLTLSDTEFQNAWRLRLGLAVQEHGPDICGACNKGIDLQVDPWHPLSCDGLKSTAMTRDRHNPCTNHIARWCSAQGAHVKWEPRAPKADRKATPRPDEKVSARDNSVGDLIVSLGNHTWLLDFTARHPTAASHAQAAAKKELATATEAEKEKTKHHEKLAEELRAKFVPIVMETFGGFGSQALTFFAEFPKLAKKLAIRWAPPEQVHGIAKVLAFEMQRGNAAVAREGVRRSLDDRARAYD